MEPAPVRQILGRLVFWLAILTFTTTAEALLSRPGQLTPETVQLRKVMPEPGNSWNFQLNGVSPRDQETNASSRDGIASSHSPESGNDKISSSLSVPCLQGGLADDNVPLEANDKVCSKPLASKQRFGLQFGHGMHTRNSMLGDFDGLMLDYGLGNFALHGVAGFPAVSGKDQIDPKNQLFGFSAASGKLAKTWDLSGYYMELKGTGRDDRSALGGAIRHSQANRSLVISADYDLSNQTLSRFMVSSAWKFLPNSTLSTTLDIHQSHLPTPQKKYLQQTMTLTDGWTWGLPLERINALSTDASNEVSAFGLSFSHAFSPKIQLKSDMAILNVSKEDVRSYLTASLSNFNEYYFYLKLTGEDLLLSGDSSAIIFRHNVSETSRLSSSLLDGSYAISRQWQITPRLQIDYRDNLDNTFQWIASPAVKVEYRWHKQSKVSFKAGGEWLNRKDSADSEYRSSYVVSLGYRADF